MNIGELVTSKIGQLKAAEIDNPSLDARLLAGHALRLDRAQLLSQSQRILSADENTAVEVLIARRMKGEPVARIIGSREFWGLKFGLNEATLEPRPDSEALIEAVLNTGKRGGRILDLGTGTGCLLLSLLHEWPLATGTGIDIALRAVEQAAKNAAALGLGGRAEFCVNNWLTGLTGKFDVIVSNPPYIRAADINGLQREVRDFDPMMALDGGEDGLGPYRLLIPQLKQFLNPNGIAAFEVGAGQAQDVMNLFKANEFSNFAAHQDLGGVARCVIAHIS